MIRHQFSYWLSVNAPDERTAGDVLVAMRLAGIAKPAGSLFCTVSGRTVSGEVDPNLGTIEEDQGIAEGLDGIAARFPAASFELEECDEENQAHIHLITWAGGKKTGDFFSRVVQDNEYDKPTVVEVARFLSERGFSDAAIALDDFQCRKV